ncbi:unnamed protein product [Closterium sp. NIES-53]
MVLGTRYRMEAQYPRNRWWLRGPAADLVHSGGEVPGFMPVHRRNRFCAFLYASWRLGHPDLSRPLLGYVRKYVSLSFQRMLSTHLSYSDTRPPPTRAFLYGRSYSLHPTPRHRPDRPPSQPPLSPSPSCGHCGANRLGQY